MRTCDVSPDDCLQRNNLRFPHQHRPPFQKIPEWPNLFGHLVDNCGQEMIRDNIPEFVKPEERDFSEQCAFTGDALRRCVRYPIAESSNGVLSEKMANGTDVAQDDIVCGNPVGRNEQQAFSGRQAVDVSNLAS